MLESQASGFACPEGEWRMEPKTMTPRILLVEGEPVQRMLLREYLEYVTGFQIVEPEGAFHLLSLCEHDRSCPDLILLDMEWPRVEGISLSLEIWKRNPDMPVLGMTDRQTELYDDKRLRGRPIALIRKPFSPYQLHRSIGAMLKAKAIQAAHRQQEALLRARSRLYALRVPQRTHP
jgi:DNA-binding NtrC family response regulator